MNWCRISSINSIIYHYRSPGNGRYFSSMLFWKIMGYLLCIVTSHPGFCLGSLQQPPAIGGFTNNGYAIGLHVTLIQIVRKLLHTYIIWFMYSMSGNQGINFWRLRFDLRHLKMHPSMISTLICLVSLRILFLAHLDCSPLYPKNSSLECGPSKGSTKSYFF